MCLNLTALNNMTFSCYGFTFVVVAFKLGEILRSILGPFRR